MTDTATLPTALLDRCDTWYEYLYYSGNGTNSGRNQWCGPLLRRCGLHLPADWQDPPSSSGLSW
eukprot:1382568-Rhodomonas_salina.1